MRSGVMMRSDVLPSTSAPLAAALASFILAEDELRSSRTPDGYVPLAIFADRERAFNRLKTIFEMEFPHV